MAALGPIPWDGTLGAWLTTRNTPLLSPHGLPCLLNLITHGQTVQQNRPLASRLSRWLKVNGTDTDRSGTYEFLSYWYRLTTPRVRHSHGRALGRLGLGLGVRVGYG